MKDFQNDFLTRIAETLADLSQQHSLSKLLCCTEQVSESFEKLIEKLEEISLKLSESEVRLNYLNHLGSNFNKIGYLNFSGEISREYIGGFTERERQQIISRLSTTSSNARKALEAFNFSFDFFEKLGFYTDHIVAIGANGSGKTMLSNRFRKELATSGLVISAQKILRIPHVVAINNPQNVRIDLSAAQSRDKSNRNEQDLHFLTTEFELVLRGLFADQHAKNQFYRNQSRSRSESGLALRPPGYTMLDRTMMIWNSLLQHRTLSCDDGMNISVDTDKSGYSAMQMSDGEKAALFLIAQVIQAPADGFIVVDEPETYLHRTILDRLWDILEDERPDCLFIFLTHDLDFAVSRKSAKKVWIRSYTHPDTWAIEAIPDNDIPQALMLELLGSRKPILFCEGEKGSLDERIYSVLFPHLTIVPCGSCQEVISYTRSYNKIPRNPTSAIGLIDSDHYGKEHLSILEALQVFSFQAAEVENLFFDSEFLDFFAEQSHSDAEAPGKLRMDILATLSKELELQISHYLTSRVDQYLKGSHMQRSSTLEGTLSSFSSYLEKIDIKTWHDERLKKLSGLIEREDYKGAIQLYNNKGLVRLANHHFKITDFTDRAFRLLRSEPKSHAYFYHYFPEKILNGLGTDQGTEQDISGS